MTVVGQPVMLLPVPEPSAPPASHKSLAEFNFDFRL